MRANNNKTEEIAVAEFLKMQKKPGSPKATASETDIMRSIRDFLRLYGWKVVRMQQSLGSEKGIPDLYAIRGGQSVWIEVKTPKGRLSKYQESWLKDLEEHGGWWIVARGIKDVEHLAGNRHV